MKLKFNENGKFKILLFGDLHENYDYAESPKFRDMQKLMNASLDRYSPDLCVLLGDVCSTHGCDEEPEKNSRLWQPPYASRCLTETYQWRSYSAIMSTTRAATMPW